MKVSLVFSPFVFPSYIPLGIAQLKSYVEKNAPSAKIINFDFNNYLFHELAKPEAVELCKEFSKIIIKNKASFKYDFVEAAELYRNGVELLTGKLSEFNNVKRYNFFVETIARFLNSVDMSIYEISKDVFEKCRPIPGFFKELLKKNIDKIKAADSGMVGFSLFTYRQLAYSLLLAKALKKELGSTIVFGGAFINYLNLTDFMKMFNFVDFVITSEGEIGLCELIRYREKGQMHKVSGLCYREKGKILKNPNRFIKKLDSLPAPDFGDLISNKYFSPFPVLPVMFSKGCYWKKCTFCVYHKAYPDVYKTKSFKKFVEDIEYYVSQGFKYFFIDDDVISADNLNMISDAIKQKGINIFFGAIVRVEKNFTPQVLKNIYSAGGRTLIWGVESACQNIIDLMNKGTNIKDICRVLEDSHRAGFYNHVFMIRGFPTQTLSEIFKDFKFLLTNREFIHSYGIHDFVLDKGSYIWQHKKEFKIKPGKDLLLYNSNKRNNLRLRATQNCFEKDAKLNIKELDGMENKMAQALRYRFLTPEHSHILIHAALGSDR